MPDLTAYLSTWIDQPVTAGIIIVAVLMAAGAALFRKRKHWQSHLRRGPILTPNEREFFHRLTRALPTYPIFPQVSLSALIAVDSQLSERHQFAIRQRFGWKRAD